MEWTDIDISQPITQKQANLLKRLKINIKMLRDRREATIAIDTKLHNNRIEDVDREQNEMAIMELWNCE